MLKERTRLEAAIATIKRLDAAVHDNVGLVEAALATIEDISVFEIRSLAVEQLR